MSTITFIAVAMMIVLADIVYEFTVISRFITDQRPDRGCSGLRRKEF